MNDRPIFLRPYLTIHPSYTTFDVIASPEHEIQTSNEKKREQFGSFAGRKLEKENFRFGEIDCKLNDLINHRRYRRRKIMEPAVPLHCSLIFYSTKLLRKSLGFEIRIQQ